MNDIVTDSNRKSHQMLAMLAISLSLQEGDWFNFLSCRLNLNPPTLCGCHSTGSVEVGPAEVGAEVGAPLLSSEISS